MAVRASRLHGDRLAAGRETRKPVPTHHPGAGAARGIDDEVVEHEAWNHPAIGRHAFNFRERPGDQLLAIYK